MVLITAADHQSTDSNLTMSTDHDDHQPTRRCSGRRKTKGCNSSQKKNKKPQRGMGVEKLERIRLQEGWRKMTEITSTNHHGFTISADRHPTALIPVQISKLGGGSVAPNVAQMGMSPARGYLGFHGQMSVGGSLPPCHDQLLQTDFWAVGSLNHSGFVGKNHVIGGVSKELPSAPNADVHCYPQHCNACHKKKKVDGHENSGARSEMYMQQMCNGGFLGLNIGSDSKNIVNHEKQDHGGKGPFVSHLGCAVGNAKQGVEVVAVHRRGSSSSDHQGGSVLMEYEFFPSGKSCNRSDSHNDDDGDLVVMKMVEGTSETSPSSSSSSCLMGAGFDATSCVDLSLKLSY